MKLEAALADADDLKQQLDLKAQETKNTAATLEQVRSANAELEVRPYPPVFSPSSPLTRLFPRSTASLQDYRRKHRGRQES
jgi:hypothetical protein